MGAIALVVLRQSVWAAGGLVETMSAQQQTLSSLLNAQQQRAMMGAMATASGLMDPPHSNAFSLAHLEQQMDPTIQLKRCAYKFRTM